jgi:hypothetical protein
MKKPPTETENSGKLLDLREKKTLREQLKSLNPNICEIQNYYISAVGKRDVKVAISQNALCDRFKQLMPEVVSINKDLYAIDRQTGILEQIKSARHLGVLIRRKDILLDFCPKLPFALSLDDFFEALRQTLPHYKSWSLFPKWPERTSHLAIKKVAPAKTGSLSRLVDYFCPSRDVDRIFIKALFATVGWSNGAGLRPLFVIAGTGEDHDSDQGTGKSKLVHMLERLWGRGASIPQGMGPDRIIALLQSLGQSNVPIIKLDNIRDFASNPILEAYITDEEISGYKLHHGFGSIKNDFTWVATGNSPHFNRDLANRTVLIKLARPKNPLPEWQETVERFIDDNREAILADVGHILTSSSVVVETAKDVARWGPWLSAVLNKLDPDAHKFMSMGQTELAASEDHLIFKDHLENYVSRYYRAYKSNVTVDSDKDCVFLSNNVIFDIYAKVAGRAARNSRTFVVINNLAKKIGLTRLKNSVRIEGHGKIRGYLLNGHKREADSQVYIITAENSLSSIVTGVKKFGDFSSLI